MHAVQLGLPCLLPDEQSLPRCDRNAGGQSVRWHAPAQWVYTQRFNRVHRRVGHVFQGRYKAILVEKDSYLLELARYVVLNPLRAGMVPRVELWAWSSYLPTCGQAPKPDWLQTDFLLAQFAPQRARAIKRYVEFVHEGARLPRETQI